MTENRPPHATVLARNRHHAFVLCPYCQKRHTHKIHTHGPQKFAPECGLFLTPQQRSTGYVFDTSQPTLAQRNKRNT